jgi:hypothetical protein
MSTSKISDHQIVDTQITDHQIVDTQITDHQIFDEMTEYVDFIRPTLHPPTGASCPPQGLDDSQHKFG